MVTGNCNDAEREASSSTSKSSSGKVSTGPSDPSEGVVLTPKNVHALRTLFNIAHRLHHLLGPAWVLVLDILNTLDRILQSPRTTTQVRLCTSHISAHCREQIPVHVTVVFHHACMTYCHLRNAAVIVLCFTLTHICNTMWLCLMLVAEYNTSYCFTSVRLVAHRNCCMCLCLLYAAVRFSHVR